jgi:hypothetical protein
MMDSADMDSLRVTVAILSWNRKDALRVALDSVRRQTIFDASQVLIVDNGSTDGSREMIRSDYPWVELHERETNSGLAEGRNILVRLSKAPIVFWMDDDCELVEDHALETLVAELEGEPRLAVVFGRILEGDDGPPHFYGPLDLDPRIWADRKMYTHSFASGGTCVRRDQFLELGGYDSDYFRFRVERSFAERCFRAGVYVCYQPAVTIIHRPHQFGRNHRVMYFYRHRNGLLGVWRYHPIGSAIFHSIEESVMRLGLCIRQRSLSRFIGLVQGTLSALWRMPRSLFVLRRPMGTAAFSRWAHARHYLIESLDDFERVPQRYPLLRFMRMELDLYSRAHRNRPRADVSPPLSEPDAPVIDRRRSAG